MTLILALGNRHNVYLLGDRRLSCAGKIVDEECCKLGVLYCANARFAFGFTGIARVLGLEIRRWLLDAIVESAPPDFSIGKLLERFRERATKDFKKLASLKTLSPSDKRLTVLFTGFVHSSNPPKLGCAIVSNFQDAEKRTDSKYAWPSFKLAVSQEKESPKTDLSFVQRVGAWRAVSQADAESIRPLLCATKPPKAIVGKATSMMLKMAERPKSRKTVGKQISWIRIPTELRADVEVGYHSNRPSHTIYLPSAVFATNEQQMICIDEPSLRAADSSTTFPLIVPRVKPNAPCPCGSGKKFKDCHAI